MNNNNINNNININNNFECNNAEIVNDDNTNNILNHINSHDEYDDDYEEEEEEEDFSIIINSIHDINVTEDTNYTYSASLTSLYNDTE